MNKKVKRFATTTIICVLVASIFGSVIVFAPPPDLVFPALIDVFVTNTSDDPVPVDVTDDTLDVTLDEPIEVTNPSGESLDVDVSGWLHTVKTGSFENHLPLPPNWGEQFNINTEGYRLITLSFVTTTSLPTYKIEFIIEHWLYCGPPCRITLAEVYLDAPDYHVDPITFEITMNEIVVYITNYSPTGAIDTGEVKGYYSMTT